MENQEKKSVGKREILLILTVLLVSVLLLFSRRLRHQDPAASVEITVDADVTETLDLSKDQELVIHTKNGGSNKLIIKNGEAWITEASCPDKLCIRQGKISSDGQIIVCLPNKMTARVIGTP